MESVGDDPNDLSFKTPADYVKQWRHNRDFLATIDRKYVDWQITVMFYTALHAVNAAAAGLGERPINHVDRNKLVKGNEVFAPIRVNYLLLYRMARFSRYDADPTSWLPEEFLNAQVLIDRVLKPIENNIQTIIKRDLKLSPIKLKD